MPYPRSERRGAIFGCLKNCPRFAVEHLSTGVAKLSGSAGLAVGLRQSRQLRCGSRLLRVIGDQVELIKERGETPSLLGGCPAFMAFAAFRPPSGPSRRRPRGERSGAKTQPRNRAQENFLITRLPSSVAAGSPGASGKVHARHRTRTRTTGATVSGKNSRQGNCPRVTRDPEQPTHCVLTARDRIEVGAIGSKRASAVTTAPRVDHAGPGALPATEGTAGTYGKNFEGFDETNSLPMPR